MLSIENPLEDSPCSSELKSFNDEKASDKLETVDLLLDNGHSLPKFSIRDYVFCTRGEDMSTNWPFSEKSLKLCLKHGLKELLPPFQSSDSMKNPLQSSFKGEIDLIINKNGSDSSGKGSTTKSFTCSNKEALQEPLIAKSEAILRRVLKKRERINQSSMKKSRMIMNLSNISHSYAKEDTEPVNVCPVCRVFSSSSNTTLNAHIDQCLSSESTPKGLGISKLIKHRIKPRKVRLMVDIYKTAKHCTLEDLDRRNGTSWASNLALPIVEADHNMQKLHFEEEILSKGPVYIDANGTKLRILSKSNGLNIDSTDLDGPQARKHTHGDSGSKLFLAKKLKKKKNQIHKQHNILKLGKKQSFEINNGLDKEILLEETDAKEQCLMKQLKGHNQVKFSKIETIKGWVCSKRSSLTKKINGMFDHPHSGEFVDGNLRDKRNDSDLNPKTLSRSPNGYSSSPRIHMPPHDESWGQLSLRKRMKLSIMESPVRHNRTKSLALEVLAEHGVNQLNKDGTSCKNDVTSPSKRRRVAIKSGAYKSEDHPFIKGKLSTHHDSVLSKSRKLSSIRKKPREQSQEHTIKAKTWCEESMEASVVRCFNRSRQLSYCFNDEEDDDTSETSMAVEETIDVSRRETNSDPSSEDEFGELQFVATQTEAHCHSQRSIENSKKLVYEAEPGILSSDHDIFCSTVTPESMLMVEGNYMEEVDPIPIPGPPGSFLPSPGRMDSDDLQGNSSLTSARFQCSIESPVATSTNSISTMAKSGPKQSEKPFTVGLPMQETLVSCSDFVVESSLPVPEANIAKATTFGQCGLRSDNTSSLPEAGSCRFGNDQQCCCLRRDYLLHNNALNHQESQLLRRRAMGTTTLFCSRGKRSPMPADNDTIPRGKISLGVSVDTQVKFNDNGDYEFADPPATPVLRLMGKNLMVINENEKNAPSPLKPFSYANPQAVSRHANESFQNTVHHKVRSLESRESFSCNQTETCVVNPPEYDVRWPNGVGNYGNMAMNPTMFSTQTINQDLTGCLIYPNVKVQPANQINATPLTYNMAKNAHQPPSMRCNSGDISSNTYREVIIMDGTRDSEDDSTVISSNDCIVRGGGTQSLSSDTQNFTPYYMTQRYKDARYNGFLFDANSSTQSPSGTHAYPF